MLLLVGNSTVPGSCIRSSGEFELAEQEVRAPSGIEFISDEFLKEVGVRGIQEKIGKEIAQSGSDDKFGRFKVRAHGAEPTTERLPDFRRISDSKILQQALNDNSELNVAVIGVNFSSDMLAIEVGSAMKKLV